jgi:hypothetical protein
MTDMDQRSVYAVEINLCRKLHSTLLAADANHLDGVSTVHHVWA